MKYLLLFAAAVFILLVGLSFLALRRRNEVLRHYLTERQDELEEKEFFRRIPRPPVETEVPAAESEPSDKESSTDDVHWGTPQ